MARLLNILTLVLLFIVPITGQAHSAGDLLLRWGPAAVVPNDDSGTISGSGGAGIAGSEVGIENGLALGITAAYMITDHIGIGLLAATPFRHELEGKGTLSSVGGLGYIKHLPPTLTAQFHLLPNHWFQPFIGVGANYTFIFDEDASRSLETALAGSTTIDLDDSFGIAFEAGFDIMLNEHWMLNAHAWYLEIESEARLKTGATRRKVDVDIDPLVFMLALGYEF